MANRLTVFGFARAAGLASGLNATVPGRKFLLVALAEDREWASAYRRAAYTAVAVFWRLRGVVAPHLADQAAVLAATNCHHG